MVRCLVPDQRLATALARYVEFLVSKEETSYRKSDLFLIHTDYRIGDEEIKELTSCPKRTILVVADDHVERDGVLSLWDPDKFTEDMYLAAVDNSPRHLLFVQDFRARLVAFFKEHGGKSGIEALDLAVQGIGNYLRSQGKGVATENDMREAFLKPGIKSWGEFRVKWEHIVEYVDLLDIGAASLTIKESCSAIDAILPEIETTGISSYKCAALEKVFTERTNDLELALSEIRLILSCRPVDCNQGLAKEE